MPTFRPELSVKNQYHLPKHRTLELKHFCLQYSDWLTAYNKLQLYSVQDLSQPKLENSFVDRTAEQAIRLKYYKDKIDMIRKAAIEADEELSDYILEAVTDNRSYNYMNMHYNIPCCRDVFYQQCRRFFWILSRYRD